MKRVIELVLTVLLIVGIAVLPSSPVASDNVGVTADPVYGTLAPYTFTLTVVNDNKILAEWTPYVDSDDNFELRRSVTEHPTTRSEGEQAYVGSDTSYTDTGGEIGLECDKYVYYYSLWAQEGVEWSSDYATADTGGGMTNTILLGILVFLALCLTIGGYALHRSSLAFAGTGVWLIAAVWGYLDAGGAWGISMGIFWMSLAMMFTTAIEAVTLSRGAEKAEDEMERKEAIDEMMEEMDADIDGRRKKRHGAE
jgi:hypothetical protein